MLTKNACSVRPSRADSLLRNAGRRNPKTTCRVSRLAWRKDDPGGHCALLPRANNAQVIWPEYETSSGQLKRSDAWPIWPQHWGETRTDLKALTILDAEQSGDTLTGQLRIRLDPEEQERLFPITFHYFRGGQEVRIRLAENPA